MAKVTLNSALQGIRGRIDNWVYRRFGDRVVIARRPEFSGEPSAGQLAVREKFRAAAAYAKGALADPVSQAVYQAAARTRGASAFATAMGDFLNAPEVQVVTLDAYRGQVGDRIVVRAVDDFEVVAVSVVLRGATATVIEEGPAALAGGLWVYTAGQAVPGGTVVTVEATATDRAGNAGKRVSPPLLVP